MERSSVERRRRMPKETDPQGTRLLSREWNRELDALSGTREGRATRLEVMYDGKHALRRWRETLMGAGHSIRLYTYYFSSRSESGREIVGIIEQKAREGVAVYILASRYAQIACGFTDVIRLRRAGCKVILIGNIGYRFPGRDKTSKRNRLIAPVPPGIRPKRCTKNVSGRGLIDYSLHAKLCIVDRETAIVGGRNIHENYFLSWEDADIYMTGPAAVDLSGRFDYEFATLGGSGPLHPPAPFGISKQGSVPVRSVLSNPWEHSFTTMDTIVHAVSSARSRIDIMTQYIIPPGPLLEALLTASAKGVEIHIITNSLASGKAVAGGLCWYISSNWYKTLLRGGIHIHEWLGRNARTYLHTKFFLVDRSWLALGSFNLSLRSSYLESEILCALRTEPYTGRASEYFETSLKERSREILKEDIEKYSIVTRFLQKAALPVKILY